MNAAEFLVVTVTSWLTPTVLFCVLNLTIVTIVITSSLNKHGHHQDNSRPQLVRVPSLLERVKSINLSLYRTQNLALFDSESAAHYTAPPQEPTDYQKSEAKVDDINHSESVEDIQVTKSRGRGGSAAAGDSERNDVYRFRQQLKLQRLDSILRYQEMINRGLQR
ncbi:Hypothetical predicted protein [Olea europaea subsp. europaea]|uniref:DUF4408 domain-containing protein n=1 Tax=Olea europaea subsp. europaea TaxID=158383 RepID=A0A8S0PB94_OLEEU|nr:Hypothetical predicted protein [Olea europaea subsp. europaea]